LSLVNFMTTFSYGLMEFGRIVLVMTRKLLSQMGPRKES
jgi:hypothetical protein